VTTRRLPFRFVAPLAAAALCVAAAGANTILAAGTPGEPGVDTDARALGMGGAALGLFDGKNVNAANPAVPASYGRAVFNITLARAYNSYDTAQGRSVEITYDIPAAELTIPFSDAVAGTLRFSQVFNPNYEFTMPLENDGKTMGTSRQRGRGEVYRLGAGAAARLGKRWYAGLAAGYDFGAPKDVYVKDFKVKGYSDITENREYSYKGVGVRAGAGFMLNDKLSLGAMAEFMPTHTVRETLFTNFAELEVSDHRFALPWQAGLGAAYVIGPRGRVAADVRYTGWSAFKVDGAPQGYKDTVQVGLGAEGRLSTSRKGLFVWRMPYRLGVFYTPWYTTTHGDLAKMGVTAGAGYLFLNNEESRLDFALEYSRRGSLGANGLAEQFYNFYLSVVGLETWVGRKGEDE